MIIKNISSLLIHILIFEKIIDNNKSAVRMWSAIWMWDAWY